MKSSNLIFLLSFAVLASDIAQAMKRTTPNPDSSVQKKARTESPSPTKIKTNVHNYCREFIQALNSALISRNLTSAKECLYNFYSKLQYNMHIKDPKFYQALLFMMCNVLSNGHAIYDEQDEIIIAALEADEYVYVLECGTIDGEKTESVEATFNYSIKNNTKPIIVLGIIFFIPDQNSRADMKLMQLKNNGSEKWNLTDNEISDLTYHDDNEYKKIIGSLCSNNPTKQTILRNRFLNNFYASIPVSLRIANEKFYQSMMYCLITFMRSSFTQAEVCTSHGRADLLLKSAENNIVVEFKFNGSIKDAQAQMADRNYADYFYDQQKSMYEIGINIQTDQDSNDIKVTTSARAHKKVLSSPIKMLDLSNKK